MGKYSGIGDAFVAIMWLSVVGVVAILGAAGWGLWWLAHHVQIGLK